MIFRFGNKRRLKRRLENEDKPSRQLTTDFLPGDFSADDCINIMPPWLPSVHLRVAVAL